MSNKGAVKKSSSSKELGKTGTTSSSSRTKSTKTSTTKDDLDKVEQRKDPPRTRRTTNIEKDRQSRGPAISNRSQTTSKTSIKQSNNASSRSSKEPSKVAPGTRTSVTRTPSTRTSSKTMGTGSSPSKVAPKVKGSTYSEKRGVSTIYVPPSLSSRLKVKTTEKTLEKSETRAKEQSSKTRDEQSSKTREETKKRITSRERKLSRTLSPSEVKMLRSVIEQTKVDKVGGGGDATEDLGNEYEEDFESYESDFQECTSSESSQLTEESSSGADSDQNNPIELRTNEQPIKTVKSAERRGTKDEEHMHDSGHYELAEARRRAAMIESIAANSSKSSPLIELNEPINKSYSEERPSENKSLPSSTDEGFEDSRSGDFVKSPQISQLSFIEFRRAKAEETAQKSKRISARGEQLLQMIKLDTMEWTLFESMPVPYEEFIRTYGRLNFVQMSTQTGEDDIEIETQTDEITLESKWTQFPIRCRTNLRTKEDLNLFRMEQLGVGCDSCTGISNAAPTFDRLRLNEFVDQAGRVILSLLEERESGGSVFRKTKNDPVFSDGVLQLSVSSLAFLSGRPIVIIHCSDAASKILLTIHSPNDEEIETSNRQDYLTDCCTGCVWNVFEPSMPIKMFYSHCPITACSFHPTNYSVVFAGLQDGSISLWDLREDEAWHQRIRDSANDKDWTIRSATYTTGLNGETHNSVIVAIRVLSRIEERSLSRGNKFVPIQICSLDENGSLFVWSVLHIVGRHNRDDLGLSHWGKIRLVKSQEISLNGPRDKNAMYLDMRVDRANNNNVYVATDTSSILRATCMGNKVHPACYEKYNINPSGNATCLEVCPFESSLLLVGCDDGTIRLHSISVERPILQLKDECSRTGIKEIRWSRSKPFIFYALGNDSRLYAWDLSNSDIDPLYSIDMAWCGNVTGFDLSSCNTRNDMAHQYLALGTESGEVEIHKLNNMFSSLRKEDYTEEVDRFIEYIKML